MALWHITACTGQQIKQLVFASVSLQLSEQLLRGRKHFDARHQQFNGQRQAAKQAADVGNLGCGLFGDREMEGDRLHASEKQLGGWVLQQTLAVREFCALWGKS